uniref:Putative secreted protein n=1 Tax=Anopheles darlingi TaxID=43151 RepID=A0A2M4DBH2_ANODA
MTFISVGVLAMRSAAVAVYCLECCPAHIMALRNAMPRDQRPFSSTWSTAGGGAIVRCLVIVATTFKGLRRSMHPSFVFFRPSAAAAAAAANRCSHDHDLDLVLKTWHAVLPSITVNNMFVRYQISLSVCRTIR